jgi:hypothetical protein
MTIIPSPLRRCYAVPRMDNQEHRTAGNLSAPLWAIAVALWVIAIVGIVGATKVYQMQEGVQKQIDRIPKLPKF